MKRDLDLCLRILEACEQSVSPVDARDIAMKVDQPSEIISYHCEILADSGLIVSLSANVQGFYLKAYRLSWSGHEFLDSARDRGHWERAKEVAHKASGGFDLIRSVLGTLASEAAKAMIGF